MLSALMEGQFLAAGELAAAAGVSARTANMHFAKLLDAELVVRRTRGWHRYVRLAGEEVAHVSEALSFVAERNADADKRQRGACKPPKAPRTCYRHLAGELGVTLSEGLVARGTLTAPDSHCALSKAGGVELCNLGIVLHVDTGMSRRFAHACFDWSERRNHLAGSFAVTLPDHSLDRGWLRRTKDSRAPLLTPPGEKTLSPWIRVTRASRRSACAARRRRGTIAPEAGCSRLAPHGRDQLARPGPAWPGSNRLGPDRTGRDRTGVA